MLTPLAKESQDILVISRIHMPESSAASFRLRAVERALVAAGARVRVLTTAPPSGASGDDDPGVEVSRWPALRDKSGYLRGYLPYMSFDVPASDHRRRREMRARAQTRPVRVVRPRRVVRCDRRHECSGSRQTGGSGDGVLRHEGRARRDRDQ